MMEAASISETSVNIYQTTRRTNPEDGHLHTRHRENLKSHMDYFLLQGFVIRTVMIILWCYFPLHGDTVPRLCNLMHASKPTNVGAVAVNHTSPTPTFNVQILLNFYLQPISVISGNNV
jgi:hypothetical protein